LAPTMGIATTGFCYPGRILQVFIDKISKFFGYQEQPSIQFRSTSSSKSKQFLSCRRIMVSIGIGFNISKTYHPVKVPSKSAMRTLQKIHETKA
jgi:hypothetical protein